MQELMNEYEERERERSNQLTTTIKCSKPLGGAGASIPAGLQAKLRVRVDDELIEYEEREREQ